METPAPYTPLKQAEQRCTNCRFSHALKYCRRHAPDPHGHWPATSPLAWCGEWESVAEYELKRTTAIHIPAERSHHE